MDSDNPSEYETSVQREMLKMANRIRHLEAELAIVRNTIKSLAESELPDLVDRIGRVLEEKTP